MSPSTQIQQLLALLNAGRYQEVEVQARSLIALHPHFGHGWKILGLAIHLQGGNALPALQKAAQLLPKDHESHINLGNALVEIDKPEEAARCYRRALKQKPDDAQAHCGLGNTLVQIGKLEEAVLCYRRALKLEPGSLLAQYNLGNALLELGHLPEAEAAHRRALELKPEFPEAHYNLGNVLHDLGQPDRAVASFRRALAIKPDYLAAHGNLILTLLLLGDQHPAEMLAEARRFGERVAQHARPFVAWRNVPDPDRCLRVGLVSGDLRNHSVGYFVEGALATLASRAAGRLEFFAYYNHSRPDALSERIKACCRSWISSVGLSDQSLAQRIRDDGIDILFDLSGHTAQDRLTMFAWKPAPVQVSWLGYLGTSGLTAMDYLIADRWTLPQTEEVHFTEKIWRLPETYVCFTPPQENAPVTASPALGNGHITFGSFNNLNKLNDAVVALWARVLDRVPDSRLFLKSRQLRDASVRQGIVERFASHDIEPGRLILEGFAPSRAAHLAAYRRVDIALDPFPYPGITTSVEGLWMGVPLLTLAGERFLSRQGIGLLMNAGLPEWIAADGDDFVAKAVAHAGNLDDLSALRAGLRQKVLASPLFDAPRFAEHFEAALRGMWHAWCSRPSPAAHAGG